jgi:ribosomal protein S18 acetylase RimI-like enzyme
VREGVGNDGARPLYLARYAEVVSRPDGARGQPRTLHWNLADRATGGADDDATNPRFQHLAAQLDTRVQFLLAEFTGHTTAAGEELSPIDDEDVPVLAIGVERDYRGRGVGGLLMDALIEQAGASGVHAISLTTGLFNDAAVRLYRRHGFVEVLRRGEGVKMVLVLD